MWWYVDALSDDGAHGLTIIAFIGSVFSPYYAWARARTPGGADPLDHCAINVALYGKGGKRWAMTERGRGGIEASRQTLVIGPSSVSWDGTALTIKVHEVGAPLPSRIRGTVRLHPAAVTTHRIALDGAGRHLWWPVAPMARVEVALEHPALSWSGTGYLDTNSGSEPLEDGFRRWDWSRAGHRDGAAIVYDAERRDGSRQVLALRFDRAGACETFEAPATRRLPGTLWGIERNMRAGSDPPPRVIETLEDTPFYARSLVAAELLGRPATGFHESLSLDRFRAGWVRMLLPFRMPRRR